MAFSTSCTSSTGASFDFDFELSISFAGQYSSQDYATLYGTTSLTIPNGDVLTETFTPQDGNGFITTLAPGQFGPYYDITFIYRPVIQTPTGEVEYIVYFSGFKQ